MNYEELYNKMKYSLFTAVKLESDRYLKLSRQSANSFECEIARQRYKALYDQVKRCGLEEDYEAWEWREEEED